MPFVEGIQLGLRCGLKVQQPLVGSWQDTQDLIELALHRCLLPDLYRPGKRCGTSQSCLENPARRSRSRGRTSVLVRISVA